jgi:hypothetical protein
MNIKLDLPGEPSEKRSYPCLKKSKNGGSLVLFVAPGKGLLLRYRCPDPMADFLDDWDEDQFVTSPPGSTVLFTQQEEQ